MIYKYNEKKKIPFVGRVDELEFILSTMQNSNATKMFIAGESGSGKTTLASQSVLELYAVKHGEINCIYLDAYDNLLTDINAAVFEHILALNLFTMKDSIQDNLESFYYSYSFKSHIKKSDISLSTVGNAIKNATAFIPNIGHIISNIIPDIDTKGLSHLPQDYNLMQVIIDYFIKLSNECTTIFIIDNYQFLSGSSKKIIEHIYKSTNNNFFSIEIVRTKKNEPDNYRYECSGVRLKYFSYEETYRLINSIYDNVPEKKIDDIYCESNKGNLKDLESFIRLNEEIMDDSATIKQNYIFLQNDLIDILKKDIGLLASIFTSGIILDDLIGILRNFSYWNDDKSLILDALDENPFVSFNKDTSIISKGHERLVANLFESCDEERFSELLDVTKRYVDFQLLDSKSNNQARYIYLMNVIISIKTTDEIIDNTSALGDYLNFLSNNYLYESIYYIYEKLTNDTDDKKTTVVNCLPIFCIKILLESFEKTSRFNQGLNFYKNYIGNNSYQSYKIKYLLQSYEYDLAAKELKNTDSIELKRIYLNLIQHERKDDTAKEIIDSLIEEESLYAHSDDYYIILRNSGHLYSFEQSKGNIIKSLRYFRNNSFYKATCINNLGLVYIYHNDCSRALKLFNIAKALFEELSSTEKYQPEFNIGLVHMLNDDYELAEQCILNAIKLTPKNLSYDIMKFYCTLHVCRYLNTSDKITKSNIRIKLENLRNSCIKHPDPWLKLCVTNNYLQILMLETNSNIKEKHDHLLNSYVGNPDIYGAIMERTINNVACKFILAISPHWRC